MVDRWNERLYETLRASFGNCFDNGKIVDAEYPGLYKYLLRIEKANEKHQLFLRGMTNGSLSERDRLLTYTLGEFYQEMSLFITECELKEKELKKLKK